jgi:hypothetical protein
VSSRIESLEVLVGWPERLLLQVHLDLAGAVGELGEARLAHDALEHHAAADGDACGIGIQPLGGALAVRGLQLTRQHVAPEIIGVGPARAPAQLGELGAPLGDQLVLIAVRLAAAGAAAAVVVLLHVVTGPP